MKASKQAARDRIWALLTRRRVARFPGAVGRIPNFVGAEAAARRLAESPAWQAARVVKCNPDAPQLPVRALALQQGKRVFMAVPRLRDERCFLELDPRRLAGRERAAASIRGAGRLGTPTRPKDMPKIDLIVAGSVAVRRDGARVGKGGGFSDLEFALLTDLGLVGRWTTVATTVHPLQIVSEPLPMLAHDIPLDLIVTPDETIRCPRRHRRPRGIVWRALTDEKIAEVPLLARLAPGKRRQRPAAQDGGRRPQKLSGRLDRHRASSDAGPRRTTRGTAEDEGSMATKMHLMWFCAYSPHAGFGLDGWSGPRTGTGYEWTGPELWQDMAAVLERAKFDLVMLGDSLAVPATYQGRMDAYLRYAEHTPFHDPGPLVAVMAAATRRIGLAATLSTTFYPPYLLARLMTTLDHLSRGRIAWNVVTSYKIEEALNFGYQELLDHDQRYDRADEYMELCYRLWSSWDPDAVVMDPGTDTFADPAKVHAIDFEGTYYRSRGPLSAAPSPQGRPVIIQAGASDRGQDFAARHAEAVIVSRETVDEMKQYYDQFKARVKQQGRDPGDCKVFFLTKPIVGDTEEAARQRAAELYANAPVEAGLASLSTMLQIDVSQFDLDKPLPGAIQTRAIQGIRSQLDRFYLSGRTPTLRDIATRKVSIDSKPYIGTPEQVADELAQVIDAVGGDGFAIRQGIWPGYVRPFAEQVVPLLQQRGVARTDYEGTTLREHLREF